MMLSATCVVLPLYNSAIPVLYSYLTILLSYPLFILLSSCLLFWEAGVQEYFGLLLLSLAELLMAGAQESARKSEGSAASRRRFLACHNCIFLLYLERERERVRDVLCIGIRSYEHIIV